MKRTSGLFIALLFLGALFSGQALSLYTDWLWFVEVGYTQVFTQIITAKLLLGLVAGSLVALLVYWSARLTLQLPRALPFTGYDWAGELPRPELIDPLLRPLILPGALLIGFFFGAQVAANWQAFVLFFAAVPFDVRDPLFGRDVGFYIFRLPAIRFVYRWLFLGLALAFVTAAAGYFLYRGVYYTSRGLSLSPRARRHLFGLLAALLAVKTVGYWLDGFELLYSTGSAAYGAGYTDVNAKLPFLRSLTVISAAAATLCVVQVFRSGWRYLLTGLAALFLVHIAGLQLYPSLVQRLRVVPNEIGAERLFIQRTIEFTRRAYGLDKVESHDFPAEERLSVADLKRNEATIKNIRLWEHRPLLATYGQLQEIRTYYKFVDVDNDRYLVDGSYRQVMLSARELSHQHLPSRIWINEHLTYTHGYGVVLGPVNQVTPEGLPEFFVKDIPPASAAPFRVTRPEIYYGELANDYVFVKTNAQELDYPAGEQNVYASYDGQGGVPVSSFWRKLLFSMRFATLRILLSNDITRESRILYYRQIQARVKKIAPFITFDRDPYIVVNGEGRLFWLVDGYTTSRHYPYSEPIRGLGNYIRNSVKAVIDAYNGTVTFYLSDPQDPIIRAYASAFPGFFKPLEAMPADLRGHIRYPQDLFILQARMYTTYHMEDPQVFYNKEDLLSIPHKVADGREEEIEPYYTIMRLPGEKKEEFILLIPFTPNKRDNMRAWLAARSDGPHYGKLIALDFPKAKLIYGPRQIDARIDQDAFISQQLSLWSQRGSQVIRGSLLAIPIETSLLYVQPLYLAAERGSLPELKRIIVAFGNQIAMEETLEESLSRLFGSGAGRQQEPVVVQAGELGDDKGLPARALEHYTRAREFLRQGNFGAFGDELGNMEKVLKEMQKRK
jgi:hypothetical protein